MHPYACIAIAAAAALAFHLPAQAGGYVEGPDLSNNRLAPTAVPIDLGSNIVRGTSGFSGPLPAGTYTFWVQELSPPIPDEPYPPYPYEFDLRVQAVPEPSAAALLLAGAAGLAWRMRRRAHRRP